jgi:hypothetical protein
VSGLWISGASGVRKVCGVTQDVVLPFQGLKAATQTFLPAIYLRELFYLPDYKLYFRFISACHFPLTQFTVRA